MKPIKQEPELGFVNEPFALFTQSGPDTERMAKERAQKHKDRADADTKQPIMFPDLLK